MATIKSILTPEIEVLTVSVDPIAPDFQAGDYVHLNPYRLDRIQSGDTDDTNGFNLLSSCCINPTCNADATHTGAAEWAGKPPFEIIDLVRDPFTLERYLLVIPI